jgi:putative transposase
MPRYVRANIPGVSYFFTVGLLERKRRLLIENINELRESFRHVRTVRPFGVDAVVVLPDHLHCIWTLPEGDADFSTRWRLIKSRFSRAIVAREWRSQRRIEKKERGIWQRRFWEHMIRDDRDMAAHVDYIHYNPVRHGLVRRVIDWPHSSFHRFVNMVTYPTEWAAGAEVENMNSEWLGKMGL